MNTILLSENANIILKKTLINKGYHLIETKRTEAVYDAVSSHADIYVCKLNHQLIIAREQFPLIEDSLLQNLIHYSIGTCELGYQYPMNIKYNAAQVGNYLIHNTKYSDPKVLARAKELGLQILHVKQGYTKCNLVIVNENAVITSDEGMAVVLKNHKIETLVISKGHVTLTGFPYGFLGGASGRVSDEIIFNGDLSAHPDFEKIQEFIRQRGLRVTFFPDYPLEDIGSIIQI